MCSKTLKTRPSETTNAYEIVRGERYPRFTQLGQIELLVTAQSTQSNMALLKLKGNDLPYYKMGNANRAI